VVGRKVGGSVVRHRVQRRLRHLMRARLAALPARALVVVRALPASAGASSAALGDELDVALRRLIDPAQASCRR
jgi:ribonuclease P protein component